MVWPIIAAAAISAAGSYFGSQSAADAQKDAAKKNSELERLGMNQSLTMIEPNRALGYGAASDLASLYGYKLPQYTPLNQLLSGQFGASNITGVGTYTPGKAGSIGVNGLISIDGRAQRGSNFGIGGPSLTSGILGGGHSTKHSGTINPITGEVSIPGAPQHAQWMTNYLRTGDQSLLGKDDRSHSLSRIISEIDNLRSQGWTYDPNRQAELDAAGAAGPTTGSTGTAGDMSRFFTAPDYQFRRDEGQRNIGNSFAARGGAASGNALRALTEFNQNTASQEYGNYVNRLMQMAGLGQVATSQGSNAVANGVAGMSQANTQAGDARASGIMGAANGVSNALNTGLNAYMLYRGGYFNRPAGT